jgi:phospholipase/carboxylesterase
VLFDGLEGDYRFVFPAGSHVVGGGPSWFPEGYYEMEADRQASVVRGLSDQLATLLGELAAAHGDAPLPVVVGASQGGDLTAALAIVHPDRVLAAVAIAAAVPLELLKDASATAPLWLLHGAVDSVVPIEKAHALGADLRSRGADPNIVEYDDVGHAVPDEIRSTVRAAIRTALA